MPMQDPDNVPHLRLEKQADLLLRHVAHFRELGDTERAAAHAAELKHTLARIEHAKRSAVFVDGLGLNHDVTPDTITSNDAIAFIAKTMHEAAQGACKPRDHVVHVLVHLGLDETHRDAVAALFAAVEGA